MGIGNLLTKVGNSLGQKIGAGYAEQGKSWDEISSMPSRGDGMMRDTISSGVKTGYDNYMANNKPASESTSSANMLQSSGGSSPMMGSAAISRGVKAWYDAYMGNYKPASESTPSANMLQSSGGSESGLAASAGGIAHQPTLTSGVQNPTADSTQFGNLPNGSGFINGLAGSSFSDNYQNYQKNYQGMQNQYGIIDGARII